MTVYVFTKAYIGERCHMHIADTQVFGSLEEARGYMMDSVKEYLEDEYATWELDEPMVEPISVNMWCVSDGDEVAMGISEHEI